MSARTRKDWILWGALGCALVSTAHAEYTLATAAHFNKYVALAVPGALDLYVVRALQQRRDVFVAVLAMVAANVTSHLIAGGVLGVRWPVIAAVGAVAPLIVWRVYSLKYTRTRQELLWDTGVLGEPGAMSAPVPDHVPADWMEEEYPETYPSVVYPCSLSEPFLRPLDDECSECGGRWGDHPGVQRKRAEHMLKYPEYADPSAPAPLYSVPPLPPEYTSDTVTEPLVELKPSDLTYLTELREYTDVHGDETTMRGIMRSLSIGQDRATRLLAHAEAEGWLK